MINTQAPEKQVQPLIANLPAQSLDVVHIFHTIQGEGPFVGRPAVFVRLAGCNLQCPNCDTDYTSNRQRLCIEDICEQIWEVASANTSLVVITGGEPFRQDFGPLVNAMTDCGWTVQVETNGTLAPSNDAFPFERCRIVCAPKTGTVSKQLWPYISAYKYVLSADNVHEWDGLPTFVLDHPAHPRVARPHIGYTGPVYLQPEDSGDVDQNNANLAAVLQSCLKYGYLLGLQIHKIVNLP